MASDELRSRLASLPGVVSCTVDEETVALLLDHDVDPRLLKARAQAVCAEMGECRPLIVAGGRNFGAARAGAGPGVGAAAAAAAGWRSGVPAFVARRATPVSIAVMSLVVLSAVVLAPDDGVGPGPLSRNPSSPSVVALAPLLKRPPLLAEPGGPALRNVSPLGPVVSSFPTEAALTTEPGPVPGGPTTTDFVLVSTTFGPAGVAPPVALLPVHVGPPVATPAGAASTPAAPSPSTTAPTAGAAPSSAPAPTAPAPTAAPPSSRSSSPLLATSRSTGKGGKSNHQGRRQPARKAASTGGRNSSADGGPSADHETPARAAGPEAKPDAPAPARDPEGPDRQEKAETPERSQPSEGRAESEPASPSGRGEKGEERSGGTGHRSGRGN